ncbi:hypothetical protein AC1031_007854 [Aphanomyces cochlioides]|nr:hypothetical protein AC1031_007854 [Aphanomyces cochlioides]
MIETENGTDLVLDENEKLPPLIDANGDEIKGDEFLIPPDEIKVMDETLGDELSSPRPKIIDETDMTSEIEGPLESENVVSTVRISDVDEGLDEKSIRPMEPLGNGSAGNISETDEKVEIFEASQSNAVNVDPALPVRNYESVSGYLRPIGNEVSEPRQNLKTGPAPYLKIEESEAVTLDTSYVAVVGTADEKFDDLGTRGSHEMTASQVHENGNGRVDEAQADEERVENLSDEIIDFEQNTDENGQESIIKPRILGRNGKPKNDESRNEEDEVVVKPVFTDEQLEAIRRGDFSGIDENHFVEIEDRLYPISKKAIIDQVLKIRAGRKDPTNQEIINELSAILGRNVEAEEANEVGRQHDLDEPDRWNSWYEATLRMCSEAPRANRNFSDHSKRIVALIAPQLQVEMARRNLFRLRELTPKDSLIVPGLNSSPKDLGYDAEMAEEISKEFVLTPEPKPLDKDLTDTSIDGANRVKFREWADYFYEPLNVSAKIPLRSLHMTRTKGRFYRRFLIGFE